MRIRELENRDLNEVARIDALHTRVPKMDYWKRIFRDFVECPEGSIHIALGAEANERLVGYIFGEVRAFEFGSDPCGWVFAVGVDPPLTRTAVASTLLAEACRRFRQAGADRVRTMVRRNDVPVLSFFRSNGFAGGSFVQLELDLEEG